MLAKRLVSHSIVEPQKQTMTPSWLLMLLVLPSFSGETITNETLIKDVTLAKQFLDQVNQEALDMCRKTGIVNWNYETNITEDNANAQVGPYQESTKFYQLTAKKASEFDAESFDDLLKRQLVKAGWTSKPTEEHLTDEEFKELNSIESKMMDIYSTTQICDYKDSKKCDLNLDPELTAIMATSRDYEELLYVWREWHEKAGRPIRPLFHRYVELKNKAAQLQGFADAGEDWRMTYESETFEADVNHLWQDVRPLYVQLHAYARRKIREKYGNRVQADTAIPAHLLGNMWAQTWMDIADILLPYPNKTSPNPAPEMIRQNYTGKRLYEVADEFFTSMGMKAVPNSFWDLSMFERPEDRKVVCHGSSFNLCGGGDVRVKDCTELTLDHLLTAHHEMGHIQYYLQYTDQPYLLQDGANQAFHEAIGDTLTLSVSTGSHLQNIGLLPNFQEDEETSLNDLMQVALKKVAFLPFGFVLDKWRWEVFSGDITPDQYNEKWWHLRHLYQGVQPAVSRSEEDFDPGAKYHVPSGTPYIRYFVGHILQFQFHQALCQAAGLYDPNNSSKPLHKCDISNNTKAGELFSKMLSMGASKPWPEALNIITEGKTKEMDAQPLLEYFKPLEEFLIRENAKYNEYIGWKDSSATRIQLSHMMLLSFLAYLVSY